MIAHSLENPVYEEVGFPFCRLDAVQRLNDQQGSVCEAGLLVSCSSLVAYITRSFLVLLR